MLRGYLSGALITASLAAFVVATFFARMAVGRLACPQLPAVRLPSRVVVIGPSGRPADETDWAVLRGEALTP